MSEITWLNAVGKADLENNVSISNSSLYRIASISKPITAVAILQLWERGLISLDTDARTYLPSFPEKKYKFSIRQLLNHTSGIRNYKEGEFDSKKFYASTEEALRVFAYDSLNFEPGTKYEYTSLDYTILAAIIEKVSKTSFDNYLKSNVFLPSGMKSTRIDNQREIILNRVRGYEKNAAGRFVNAPLADLSIKVAGGGLLSTVEDLLLFSKALLEHKLLKQSTLNLIKPTKTLSDDLMKNYLAFGIDSTNQRLNYIYLNEQSAFTSTENEAILFSADLLSLNKSGDAIVYLKELLKIYPKSFKITVAIADSYLKDKNEGFALRYYRTSVQLNPYDTRVNNLVK